MSKSTIVYYYEDTGRVEYRNILLEGERITPDEMEQMKSFGCYNFYVNRYITEFGDIMDEVCYSIDRAILEQDMPTAELERWDGVFKNNSIKTEKQLVDAHKNNPNVVIHKAQLIETIQL